MPEQGYKRCRICREAKPLANFSREKRAKDGKRSVCKSCDTARAKAWRQRNLDRARENDRRYAKANAEKKRAVARRWREENPERVVELNRRWHRENPEQAAQLKREWKRKNPEKVSASHKRHREKYPEKEEARTALRNAVQLGKLEKPANCEGCGKAKSPRPLHGHHADYSKPLEVEWLCPPCHQARHS